MLRTLDIRDILIIDRLELAFQPGLNVLTGETGAGKSILLDALGFVLGWRGRAELVREGAAQGEVEAVFDLPAAHPARRVLEDAGLPNDPELILRRVNRADGRKSAWVNDRRASGDVLRRLSDTLVELHGQHDDRGLLNPRGHRDLLDAFGGHAALRQSVRAAWAQRRATATAVETAMAALEAIRAEEDFLRHAVGELDALDPQPGEDAALDSQRRLMQSAEKIRDDISRAHKALGREGAEGAAQDALRWLEDVANHAETDAVDAPIGALGRALIELGDALSGIESCLDTLRVDPHELERVEERLFEIRRLSRKHGLVPDDLSGFAEDLRTRLAALEGGDADLARLRAEHGAAEAAYKSAADALTGARKTAAAALDAAVMTELAPLKLERAVFATDIGSEPHGPNGCDAVAFTVATNPGAPAGPINKIASGGELSRFLLALKVCLAGDASGLTMIFDEIDRGVGGATADAVGRRLEELAQGGQVLVVTHSPQVAARGGHHWRVAKAVRDGATLSTVVALDAPDRVDEIARMLAGDTITEEARAAARALLNP
ncbi:MAG: DNA repair protein RecN [Pseudomonadota bacterium]